jgi:hypothetical protein
MTLGPGGVVEFGLKQYVLKQFVHISDRFMEGDMFNRARSTTAH